jgi:hypothetical protein
MRRSFVRSRVVRFWALSACLALCVLLLPSLAAAQTPPRVDASLSPDQRVALLLPQMARGEGRPDDGRQPRAGGHRRVLQRRHPAVGHPGAAHGRHRARGQVRRHADDGLPDGPRDRGHVKPRSGRAARSGGGRRGPRYAAQHPPIGVRRRPLERAAVPGAVPRAPPRTRLGTRDHARGARAPPRPPAAPAARDPGTAAKPTVPPPPDRRGPRGDRARRRDASGSGRTAVRALVLSRARGSGWLVTRLSDI